jgi:hypothetical protein
MKLLVMSPSFTFLLLSPSLYHLVNVNDHVPLQQLAYFHTHIKQNVKLQLKNIADPSDGGSTISGCESNDNEYAGVSNMK